MARDFSELEREMPVESRVRATAKAREQVKEMLLGEVRRQMGLTQEEVAEALGVTQPSLSKMENQDDMLLSTLRRLIEALGGQLEIIAHLPEGDVRIGRFRDAS